MSTRPNTKKPSLRNANWQALAGTARGSIENRGRTYFYQQRATVLEAEETRAVVLVRGNRPQAYRVSVALHPSDPSRYLSVDCDCPFADHDPLVVCKHKVAAFLELGAYYRTHPPETWSHLLGAALEESTQPRSSAKSILVFRLNGEHGYRPITPMVAPAGKIPAEIVHDQEALAEYLQTDPAAPDFRESQTRIPSRVINATPGHLAAANAVLQDPYYYGSEATIDLALTLMDGALIFEGTYSDPIGRRILVSREPGKLEIEVSHTDEGLRMIGRILHGEERVEMNRKSVRVLSERASWVIAGSKILKVDTPIHLIALFLRRSQIAIPESETDEFYRNYLPALLEHATVRGDGIGEWRDLSSAPTPRVFLREVDSRLVSELRFGYGDYEIAYDPLLPAQSVFHDAQIPALVRIHRDPESEQQRWKSLSGYGLKREGNEGLFVLRQNVSAVDFMIRHVPRLAADGFEIYGEEEIKSIRVNRSKPKISLWVSSGIDWFDVKAVAEFGDTQVSFAEIRKAVHKRERFVKLADGSVGEIPQEWVDRYKYLFDLSEETNEGMRLAKSQMVLLEEALSEADSTDADDDVHERLAKLRGLESISEQPLPAGLHGELRHYQKAGFDWLHFLHDYGFGGCLADDMGIGKTIQALAFLQSLRENGSAPAADLIVMPRSLLVNWAREARRFTPNLRILTYADLDRPKDVAEFDGYDLILTTYGVMRRDLDTLKTYRFHYAILDESQAVKNPLAQTARAVRLLKSDHRLVLTGTPVENSTMELWSQFAFLNPGMLGSMDYFKKEFAAAIERRQDGEVARKLRAMVYPFILRRTKQQVAPELPPLEEQVIFCDMEPAQRHLYEKTRDKYRSELLGLVEQKGMNAARMRVLEGLLRLRQICNHPRLIDPASRAESAKFEVLMDVLETLLAEGHKALIFSQFTRMLKLIRHELDHRKITYQYLDGSTIDRQARVDQFQSSPDVPFFLISLKAGGVGLNLTAADYVIHVDPWWNPAVERQASDRTHRIGQDNPVFVNKLIARDTVEEKMLELQDRKKNLVDQLISTETSFFKSLTAGDVEELFS